MAILNIYEDRQGNRYGEVSGEASQDYNYIQALIKSPSTGEFVPTMILQGKSTYEIAKSNGYAGTEDEWLASVSYNLNASVKMFGAVGDGVTDDTEAIRKALNSENFEAVIFEPGIYRITEEITIESDKIKLIDGNNSIILTNSGHNFKFTHAATVQNFIFDCENKEIKSVLQFINLLPDNQEIVKLSNLIVKNVKDMEAGYSSTLINIQGFEFNIKNCHFCVCNLGLTDKNDSVAADSVVSV